VRSAFVLATLFLLLNALLFVATAFALQQVRPSQRDLETANGDRRAALGLHLLKAPDPHPSGHPLGYHPLLPRSRLGLPCLRRRERRHGGPGHFTVHVEAMERMRIVRVRITPPPSTPAPQRYESLLSAAAASGSASGAATAGCLASVITKLCAVLPRPSNSKHL